MLSIVGKTTRSIKETVKLFLQILHDRRIRKGSDADYRIATYGFPKGETGSWFCSLIEERTGKKVAFSWYKPSLLLTSLFGISWLLKILLSTCKQPSVFFSGENLRTLKKYRDYRDYLGSLPSLALGFDHGERDNYRRFPLWLLYIFPAVFAARASVQDIQKRLDRIERRSLKPKKKFAAMIASHSGYHNRNKNDGDGALVSRADITKLVKRIEHIHCPGKLLHNDNSLLEKFDDDKKKYLQQFRFNICAENAAAPGYVTEKLFESFEAGAIPIYWGDYPPEPAIVNPERIIFWHGDSDNSEALRKIKEINSSETKRQQFLANPIFRKTAAAEIFNYFQIINTDLIELLSKKTK
jgi:hypothetical protein